VGRITGARVTGQGRTCPVFMGFVMSGRLAQGKWNTGFFDDKTGNLIDSLDCKARITKVSFTPDGSKMFVAGGVGQPEAKDGNYPPFGRVFVYDLA